MAFESAANLLTICLKETALTAVIFMSRIAYLIYILNALKLFCENVIFSFKQWKIF